MYNVLLFHKEVRDENAMYLHVTCYKVLYLELMMIASLVITIVIYFIFVLLGFE